MFFKLRVSIISKNVWYLFGAPEHLKSSGSDECYQNYKKCIKKVININPHTDLATKLNKFLFRYKNTTHITIQNLLAKNLILGKSLTLDEDKTMLKIFLLIRLKQIAIQ